MIYCDVMYDMRIRSIMHQCNVKVMLYDYVYMMCMYIILYVVVCEIRILE